MSKTLNQDELALGLDLNAKTGTNVLFRNQTKVDLETL